MVNYSPVKMLEYLRDGLVEQEHYGLLVKVSSDGAVFKLGDDCNYPFYLRSCAKPLQAALIIDFGIDEEFNMKREEIALCCASHAGEECHAEVAKGFLEKIGVDESYMKCGLHQPLSKTERHKLTGKRKEGRGKRNELPWSFFHNNCSGKHVMMLAICKKMGWGLNDYDSPEHPLQLEIQKKIYELCEISFAINSSPLAGEDAFQCEQKSASIRKAGEGYKNEHYPITKDGCGVPIYSMPLENMVQGYLNLFLDEKYSKIREAFVQHPYLIGGEDRFDTAIMTTNSDLIAKSGAGGICIVVNLEQKEGFVIKIMDSDMKARAICTIEALKQLGWLNEEALENDLIKAQNKTDILTLHGEKIGSAKCTFKLN